MSFISKVSVGVGLVTLGAIGTLLTLGFTESGVELELTAEIDVMIDKVEAGEPITRAELEDLRKKLQTKVWEGHLILKHSARTLLDHIDSRLLTIKLAE
jgi:hypothetical protein